MDVLALTKERIVALVIVVLNVVLALLFATVSHNLGIIAASALGLSLPGLAMIWFREALSVTGFDRGVLRESPPLIIDVIGWLFLVLLPVLFLYGLLAKLEGEPVRSSSVRIEASGSQSCFGRGQRFFVDGEKVSRDLEELRHAAAATNVEDDV